MHRYLLTLFLIITSFNVLGQSECATQVEVKFAFKENFIVEYKLDREIYGLNFDNPLGVITSFNGYAASVVKESNLNGIALIPPKKTKLLQLSMRPLNRFVNAAYSPYLKINQTHGVYLGALIPSHFQLNNQGQWKKINTSCIHFKQAGDVNLSPLTFNKNDDLGFVLLGQNQPPMATDKTAHVEYFIDDTLPKWIKNLVLKNTDRFIDYYRNKLNLKLASKAKIVVAFEQAEQPFFDGGVHKNTIVIRFGGEAYKKSDPLASQKITEFLAHELFHLWSDDSKHKTSWIHEGAAQYASILAAKDLRLISKDEYNANIAQHSYRCLMSYGGTRIPDKVAWQGRYDCGVALLNGLLKTDFFSYWKKQIESELRSDLSFLKAFVSSEQRQLLTVLTGAKAPAPLVASAFALLISPFEVNNRFSEYLIKQQVFINLMKANCQGLVSFSVFGEYMEIYPQTKCQKPFDKITGLTKSMNGIDLSSTSKSILGSYLRSCNAEQKVTLSGDSFNVTLACYIDDVLLDTIKLNES